VKILHGSLLALSLIFASIGLKAVFDSHNLDTPPKENLYSIHSWIGMTAVVFFGLQWVAGFVSFLFPTLSEVRNSKKKSFLLKYSFVFVVFSVINFGVKLFLFLLLVQF